MDKECEVKLRVKDLSSVRANIIRLGGMWLGTYREEDYYVDLRNCVSAEYRDLVFRIRVRDAGGVVDGELTLKGPKKASQTFKVRDELIIKIDRPHELIDFLRKLTFKTLRVFKVREIYHLRGFKVFLDEVQDLGSFVEIEMRCVEDLTAMEGELSELLKELGLEGEVISKSYAEMLMEVRKFEG